MSKTENIAELSNPEPLEKVIDQMVLYHGSNVPGIQKFNPAEETTIGTGVYLTDKNTATGYANRRFNSGKGVPTLYQVEVQKLKLANLTDETNVQTILPGFRTVLEKELATPNITWYHENAISTAINAINSGTIHAGNLRQIAFSNGVSFSSYLNSLGFDGLIAIEGGEGSIGDHKSYVVFNPEKIQIQSEESVT